LVGVGYQKFEPKQFSLCVHWLVYLLVLVYYIVVMVLNCVQVYHFCWSCYRTMCSLGNLVGLVVGVGVGVGMTILVLRGCGY